MPRKKTTPDTTAPTNKPAPQSFASSIKYNSDPVQKFSLYPSDQSPAKTEPTFDELLDGYRKGELKDVQLADLQMRMKKRLEDEQSGTSTARPKRYNVFNGQMFPDPEGAYTLSEALQVRALDTMQQPGSADSGEKVSDILSAVHPYITQPVSVDKDESLQNTLIASIIGNIPSPQDQLNTSMQISQMIENAKPQPVAPAPPVDPNAQIMGAINLFSQLKDIFASPAPAISNTSVLDVGGTPVAIETMEKYFGLQMKIEDFNEKKRMMGTVRESIPAAIKAIGEMALGLQNKDKPEQRTLQKDEKVAEQGVATGNWEKVVCQEPKCGMNFLVPPGQSDHVFCPKCSKIYLDNLNKQAQERMNKQGEQDTIGDNGHQKSMD